MKFANKHILIFILYLSLAHSGIVLSELYKCKNIEGTIEFQDRPCEESKIDVDIDKITGLSFKNKTRKQYLNSNKRKLHMEKPKFSRLNPECNTYSSLETCTCQYRQYRMFGKDNDLIKNMKRLSSLWKEYDRLESRFARDPFNNVTSSELNNNNPDTDNDNQINKINKKYSKLDHLGCRIQVVQNRINRQFNDRKNFLLGEITLRNLSLESEMNSQYAGDREKENKNIIDELNEHAEKLGMDKIEY